jgi:hypothetical protein
MRCRESPLLPSEVDAAVSGETSLDHESAARVGGDRSHDGHVLYFSAVVKSGDSDPLNLDGAREAVQRTMRDGHRAFDVIARLRALFNKKEPDLSRWTLMTRHER